VTIRAGGIKVSPPLAQLDLARGTPPDDALADLLGRLAAERINVTFLTHAGPGATTAASLCVAQTDRSRAEEVARGLPVKPRLSVVAPVVAVSVFPHGANAGLLGAILRTLAHRELKLLGLATSLSALTFTLRASHLARALAGLDEILELPPNHAPLRWELRVKQEPT
jgi:hypothetical protein